MAAPKHQIVALSAEQNCVDTVGTVPVRRTGHCQCNFF